MIYPLIGFRSANVPVKAWDTQYLSGEWDYLGSMHSLGGLASIMGYCQYLAPVAILDVGCGAGLLAKKLKVLDYQKYVGIDFSPEAVNQARGLVNDRTRFEVADGHKFHTTETFDLIVFNQSIYYMLDPGGIIKKYARFLSPEGRIIVSMYDGPQTRAAWKPILQAMSAEDSMTIQQGRGRVTTKVLKPSGRP